MQSEDAPPAAPRPDRPVAAPQPDRPVAAPASRARVVAWTFVGVQFLLLGVAVLPPAGDAWPVPTAFARAATVLSAVALVLMAVAGLRLGRGLTAAPLPNRHARLRTDGLYRWTRHPIYSALLLLTVAQAGSSGRWASAAAAGLLVVLIRSKARWEEARLAERFPDYPAYAARTGRFVPRLRGWHRPAA